MGRLSASLLVLALALAALGLAACGSGDDAELLPGSTASEITANLDQVKQLATEGDCIGAEDAAQAVSAQIEELGAVDAKLKQALREGATRLSEVVAGCEEEAAEETLPAIEPAEELEEAEEEDKKEKPEKPEKPDEESEEEGEEEAGSPSLPPQAKGEAKGHEKQEEVPPAETGGGTPSGGVGPGTEVGGD